MSKPSTTKSSSRSARCRSRPTTLPASPTTSSAFRPTATTRRRTRACSRCCRAACRRRCWCRPADLFEETSIGTGRFAFGVRSARLATAAMALGGMFVLQSPSSNLYALRAQIGRGLASPGPALFSVFSVPGPAAGGLPPYLVAAAALQSRAFPAFSYEARAGGNWAARFSLENNPRRDDDWPVEDVEYVDTALQRVTSLGRSRSPISRCATRAIRRTSPAWPARHGARRCCPPPTGSRSTRARRHGGSRICWPSTMKMRCTASSSICA